MAPSASWLARRPARHTTAHSPCHVLVRNSNPGQASKRAAPETLPLARPAHRGMVAAAMDIVIAAGVGARDTSRLIGRLRVSWPWACTGMRKVARRDQEHRIMAR